MGEQVESWDYVAGAVDRLVDALDEASIPVDAVVAVPRGGWIPARLVAERLGVKQLYSYGVTYDDQHPTSLLVYQRPELIGANILLIEDAVESGRSLQHARDDLSTNNRVTSAALVVKRSRNYTPDLWLDERASIPAMPWEQT